MHRKPVLALNKYALSGECAMHCFQCVFLLLCPCVAGNFLGPLRDSPHRMRPMHKVIHSPKTQYPRGFPGAPEGAATRS